MGGWFIALVVVHIVYYTSKFNEFMEEKFFSKYGSYFKGLFILLLLVFLFL